MGEPPEAAVMTTFGGPDETCEERSEAERCRIQAEFERLRRLLAEQERAVLGRLAELDDTFASTHAEKSLRVAEGVAQVHSLIGQLETRCLPQDVGSLLSRWSEMRLHLPSGLPKELEKSLSSCCRQSDALWEALEKFRALLATPVRGHSHPRRDFQRLAAGCAPRRRPYRGALSRARAATGAARTAPPARCGSSSAVSPSSQLFWWLRHGHGSVRRLYRRLGRGQLTPHSTATATCHELKVDMTLQGPWSL